MTKQLSTPNHPWAEPAQAVCDRLDVFATRGLDGDEAKRRRDQYGPNRLRQTQQRSTWEILVVQFKSLVVLLLVAAAAVSYLIKTGRLFSTGLPGMKSLSWLVWRFWRSILFTAV